MCNSANSDPKKGAMNRRIFFFSHVQVERHSKKNPKRHQKNQPGLLAGASAPRQPQPGQCSPGPLEGALGLQ